MLPLTQKMSALVIDDSGESWHQLRQLLQALEIRAIERVESGTAALHKLKSGNFDLIFSSRLLPDVRAADLVQVLRYCPKLSRTPFIIVSVENEKREILDSLEHGASDYILKPLTLALLKERIAKACVEEECQTFVLWNEALHIGIAAIDDQHKGLVTLINALHDAVRLGRAQERIEWALTELLHYTEEHFTYEEELLAFHGYPQLEAHKLAHSKLKTQVLELHAHLKAQPVGVSLETFQFLKHWLTKHIMGVDKAYGSHLQRA